MRTLALISALVGATWLAASSDVLPDYAARSAVQDLGVARAASLARTTPEPVPAATLTEVVQRYCVACHNDQLLTGGVSLAAFDVELAARNPETAERVIRKLRAGMMPPPGMPRPSADTLLALVETIESRIDEGARSAPNLGS